MTFDAIVVGSGMIGAACARELKDAGYKVLLIDRVTPGSVVTAACMGHIVVMDDNPAELALTLYSRQLWDELSPLLPANCESHSAGTLWIAEDDEDLAAIQKKCQVLNQAKMSSEIVNSQQIQKLEPNLRPGLVGGLRVAGDRVVYPTQCVNYLIAGIDFLQGEVVKLEEGLVTLKDGSKIHAGCIVLAGGTDCVSLLPELPLKPRKGHLLITERYNDFVKHQIIETGYLKSAHGTDAESVAFNIQPRSTGQLLIGSSREFVGIDKSINHKILQKMLHRAMYFLPNLARLQGLRTWVGFRPSSADGLPYIGSWKDQKDLWLCTGHEGLGITTSLASAKILVAQILNKVSLIDATPFDPARIFHG